MTAMSTGPGVVLDLIRSGAATTRRELVDRLGWSRVTLSRRLDELLGAGLIETVGQQSSSGGRPPEQFAIAADAGVILAIDVGGSHTRIGVTDLSSAVLTEDEADIGLFDGPDEIFSWAMQVFDFLLPRVGRSRAHVKAVGVGVPGPVDVTTNLLGTPQNDRRWEGIRIEDYLAQYLDRAVVAVDRDVNIMALGEHRLAWPGYRDLVVVKVGMGIGCAFVWNGGVYRGARGGAGTISAPRTGRPSDPLVRLEQVASGRVIRDRLAEAGRTVSTSAEIVALARSGDRLVVQLVEECGELIGAALADVVGLVNPEAVVVGGNLAGAGERFLGAIRAGILGTTHPFSRRGLQIEASRLGPKAGVRGASLIAQDALFDAERVERTLREEPAFRLDTPSVSFA
ncbi:putative NBD/HSP70 family sugar kinase [Diaminobutyricimonas aerilata]|uniref:Putative NBD/HSP70 family sugar kinase n=2 Tax=Diaminobutyricimonas aerilata TaxID=1162967 RepID=A0A2M9CJE2_9MICO|nr:putative NBD/HSP70 family sugar kinase [Diaminobutyricimonas aerilata]